MSVLKSHIINPAAILFPTLMFFTCTDPEYPFTLDNVRVVADFPDTVEITDFTIGDSFAVNLAIEGVEFIDSIGVVFCGDSTVWHNENGNALWYDTIHLKYRCSTTGRTIFAFQTFLNDQTSLHDSVGLEISGKPAVIAGHPSDTTVDERTSLTLFTEASGTDTIRYRWLKNDSLLSDYTGDTLLIDSVNLVEAGDYVCIVENGWGNPDTSETASVVVRHVNHGPSTVYDTAVIAVREADSVRAIVVVNDPDGDTVKLIGSTVDSLKALGEDVVCTAAGDSMIYTVKPVWQPGHSIRELRLDAIFSDGFAYDTAHLRFLVTDSNFTPRWKTDPFIRIDSASAGEGITIPLGSLLEEPDNDPVELSLLDGPPVRDTLAADVMSYSLRSIYAVPGDYKVKIVARDIYGASDTLTIELSIKEGK